MTTLMYTNPDTRPLIVFVGNSLVSGYGLAYPDSYPEQVMDILGRDNYACANLGVASRKTTEMQAQDAVGVDPLLALPNTRKILVAWEVTNDLVLDAASAATAYTNWSTYCQARQAAGWTNLLTLTVIARSAGPTFDERRLAVNELLRASATCGTIVDAGAAPHLSTAGDENDTAYYQDAIHTTTAGAAIVAALVSAAIAA